MTHKRALKAVVWFTKDLRGDLRRFSWVMILLSRDFCQTLPIIPKSTTADELYACLKSSLWRHFKKLKLTTNIKLHCRTHWLLNFRENYWRLPMVKFLFMFQLYWYRSRQIFVISHRWKRNSSLKFSPEL
jgi:ATP-dependent DNA helicase PIF1